MTADLAGVWYLDTAGNRAGIDNIIFLSILVDACPFHNDRVHVPLGWHWQC